MSRGELRTNLDFLKEYLFPALSAYFLRNDVGRYVSERNPLVKYCSCV